MNCARPIPFVAVIAFLSFSAGGCGGSKEGNAKVPSADQLPLAIEHESCDVTSSSAEKLDTNGDGKPDIVRVTSGGREVCRMVDLNHDDKPDSFVYFEPSGAIRRRESDFDRDGRIDEVAYYAAGVVTRKDRETNLDGKLDTWDFYEGGKVHHRMRDSDGDGKVDQWWSWPNPDKVECAVIASDHKGDGKPDPSNVIDVCAAAAGTGAPASDGGVSSPAPAPSAAATADAAVTLAASTSALTPPEAGAAGAPSASGDAGAPKKAAAKKKESK